MTGNRWWHVLVALTIGVLAIVAIVNLVGGGRRDVVALAALAVIAAAYATLGRRGFESPRFAYPFLVIVIVGSGVATAGDTTMAFIQCIAMPLLWIMIEPTVGAIIGSALLTVSVAAGMSTVLGLTTESFAAVALIQGVTFVGSLALGIWITRIAELSAERARLLDELRRAQSEVEALGREAGSADERARWAREVHDTIAQSLTGLVLLGQRARRELAGGTEPSALADTLELLEETARDALVETRSLVVATAPVDLGGGIGAALDRLGRRFERETGIEVGVVVDARIGDGEAASARELEVVLLRCAQEGLANVRKHSGASSADIALQVVGSELVLTVHDDGRGFDTSSGSVADGFGLAGMRERLALVRGRLDVRSRPGHGATLTAALTISGVGA